MTWKGNTLVWMPLWKLPGRMPGCFGKSVQTGPQEVKTETLLLCSLLKVSKYPTTQDQCVEGKDQ